MEKQERLTGQLVIRVTSNIEKLVRTVSDARGEQMSDFVRRAVKMELAKLSYLSDDEKKALGINK